MDSVRPMALMFDDVDVNDDVAVNYRIDQVARRLGRPMPRRNTREFVIGKLRAHAEKSRG